MELYRKLLESKTKAWKYFLIVFHFQKLQDEEILTDHAVPFRSEVFKINIDNVKNFKRHIEIAAL